MAVPPGAGKRVARVKNLERRVIDAALGEVRARSRDERSAFRAGVPLCEVAVSAIHGQSGATNA